MLFYKIVCGAARLVLTPRVRFTGRENIPVSGPVVLIGNHRNAYDPIAMGITTRRPVHFLSKKELFTKRFARWFLNKLLCIPIDRDGIDRQAMRQSVEVLENGEVLGVFPEGTRSLDGALLPFKSGVSFIASQSPCTIVPMSIIGSERLFHFFSPPVEVRIGTAFPYEALAGEKRRQTIERMTQKQEDAVRKLL